MRSWVETLGRKEDLEVVQDAHLDGLGEGREFREVKGVAGVWIMLE